MTWHWQRSVAIGAIATLISGCAAQGSPSGMTARPTGSAAPTQAVATAAPSVAPAVGLWSATGSMIAARTGHTATLLPDGKVLVAGGGRDDFGAGALSSAELYNPATGKWTATSSMKTPRA